MVEIMISIPVIFVTIFVGAILTYLIKLIMPKVEAYFALLVSAATSYMAFALPKTESIYKFNLGSFNLMWGNNEYSHLFAMLVAVLGFFVVLYSMDFMAGKVNLGFYYFNLLVSIGSMLGIVYSQDFLSLFIFWEIMTWSSFMLVIYAQDEKFSVGIKYFVFSAIGAYLLLTALVILYTNSGSFLLEDNINNFIYLSSQNQILVIIFLIIGFGVKAAMMPFHVWAPDAYKAAPSSFTALFSGALSKMGIFGIGLVLFKFAIQNTDYFTYFQFALAWLGGITALLSTFYAVFQTDAKKLLAYSSIGQLGYIIVGLAVGTPLSIMSALLLTILHGAFKAMLFMSAGAVYYRTGLLDMNETRGLIRKMPLTFLTALMGIITVAGVPPLGGFVSKWMLYEALIQSNYYFLVIIIFVASTAAFLYLYRFIFSLFLGQEEKEFENVKEVPIKMIIPMLLLAGFTLAVGVVPGFVLEQISKAMGYLGIQTPNWENSVLFSNWENSSVNLMSVATSIGILFVLGAIFLTIKNYRSTRYVTTKDIHTSGEVPTENENLTFAVNFYQPFERSLGSVIKPSIDRIFNLIGKNIESAADYLRYIYTGNGQTYAMYVILFFVVLILFADLMFGFKF